MKKLLVLLFAFSINLLYSQSYDDTVKFDCMEMYDWSGNWYFSQPTTGFYTNASKSSPLSAVIYGTGGSADEYDWYSLPNISGLDPFLEYKVQINLGSYRFTSTGAGSGVDASDYIDVQVSLDGGSTYNSELRVTGFNNAYWDYNNAVASTQVNGSVEIFTPSAGGNRTATGDGYSVLEVILPFGTTQVAIDILSVVDRAGEEWWIDDIFLLGTKNFALPVELLYFEGNIEDNFNELEWSTASELNSERFDIEWSTDAYEWKTIGTIPGSGNSNITLDYSFIEMNPLKTINYYRLVQHDYDGNFEIFGPISIDNRVREKKIFKYLSISGQEIDPNKFSGLVIVLYEDGTSSKEYLK